HHELDRHHHDERVAPHEDADGADGEQHRREDEEVADRQLVEDVVHATSFFAGPSSRWCGRATAMPPTTATRSTSDTASNGNRYSLNRTLPTERVEPKASSRGGALPGCSAAPPFTTTSTGCGLGAAISACGWSLI